MHTVAKDTASERPDAPATIVTMTAEWFSARTARIRAVADLALAEVQLAAASIAVMVFLAILSAAFALSAWGLVIAGLVYGLLQLGVSLWMVLPALACLHALGALLLWRAAVRTTDHTQFRATRAQLGRSQSQREAEEAGS